MKGDLPIFLDTNVLLGYYGMSKSEKEKLLEVFRNLKDRIYLTDQIEKEFLKNRISVIKKDLFVPLNSISTDFKKMRNEISGKFQSFREEKKKILSQDYPEIWNKIQEIESQAKAILMDENVLSELEEKVSETVQTHKNIAYIDNLLDIVSDFKVTQPLEKDEIEFLSSVYIEMLEKYQNEKENLKWQIAFPGCGEKKEDNPEGDFYIFHEILKFIKEKNCSCIFLTNDVTKDDWLQKDKNPFVHYIENAYLLTNNVVFIIHAEQSLPNIQFENIHKEVAPIQDLEVNDTKESTIITINRDKGFGFIFTEKGNLYFSRDNFEGSFKDITKNDIVSYNVSTNAYNDEIAVNVKKEIYSFENTSKLIASSKISSIKKDRGFGFIEAQPSNLYFHQTFLENPQDFNSLDVNDEVEFIMGKNYDGENIARLVRISEKNKLSQNDNEKKINI